MLITKEVEVGLTGNNIKHYEDLEYYIPRYITKKGKSVVKRGTKIVVKVEDLTPRSIVRIEVLCDYCLKENRETLLTPTYSDYNRKKENGIIKDDCCVACSIEKRNESNLLTYGVKNTTELQETSIKRKETFIDKYGVDHPMKLKSIQEKTKITNIERYGVPYLMQSEEMMNRAKTTNMDKYGVEWHIQSEEIKDKIKLTNLDRYGFEYLFESEEFQEQLTQNIFDKYGVKSYMQVPIFQDKAKNTNLERYGVENIFMSPEFRKVIKQTNLDKYGFENVMQNEEIKQKQMASMYKGGNIRSSKQQRYINKLYNGELNYYVNGKCFVDVGLLEEDIYIEWDGSGH